ncbi:hypothetical protein, partial [Acinetobacter baumannii]|uniref:hypothetical protein n=1 Tax=Acinetobacter baumannii TaxID=470 RepID=UPI001C43E06D
MELPPIRNLFSWCIFFTHAGNVEKSSFALIKSASTCQASTVRSIVMHFIAGSPVGFSFYGMEHKE